MVKLAFGKGPKHRCGLLLVLLVWAALLSGCVQRSIERSTFRTVVIDPGHGVMIPAQIHVVFRQRNFGLFKLACDYRNAWPKADFIRC